MSESTVRGIRAYVSCDRGHEAGQHSEECADVWICRCGNRCEDSGFYTVDVAGNEVEPTAEEWTSGLVTCSGCGSQIIVATGEILGGGPTTKWLLDVAAFEARPRCPGGHSGPCAS